MKQRAAGYGSIAPISDTHRLDATSCGQIDATRLFGRHAAGLGARRCAQGRRARRRQGRQGGVKGDRSKVYIAGPNVSATRAPLAPIGSATPVVPRGNIPGNIAQISVRKRNRRAIRNRTPTFPISLHGRTSSVRKQQRRFLVSSARPGFQFARRQASADP